MNKIDLVLADKDLDYVNRFFRYFRSSEYRQIFAIKAFTDEKLFSEYLQSSSGRGIICYSSDYWQYVIDYGQDFISLFMTAEAGDLIGHTPIYAISKLQPLDALLSEIYSIFLSDNPDYKQRNISNRTKVIGVQSADSGFYKNEFTFNLARFLAGEGFKVFYLNLELLNASEIFLGQATKFDLSKIIYHLRKDPNKLSAHLERYKSNSNYYNLNYFERARSVAELLELDVTDINNLVTSIKNLCLYDYLIIDSDLIFNKIDNSLIHLIDYSLMIVENSSYSTNMLEQYHSYLTQKNYSETNDLLKKLNYILVHHYGTSQQVQVCEGCDYIGYVESELIGASARDCKLDSYFAGLELFLKELTK